MSKIYLRLLAASVRAQMQYRFDFLVSTVLYAALTMIDFGTVAVILARFKVVGGWELPQVALLAGVATTAWGLYRTFASEIHEIEPYLASGSFDALLVRPYPPLLLLTAQRFDLGRIGGIFQGLLVLGAGLWSFLASGGGALAALYILLLPLPAFGIMLGLSLATAGVGFWIIRVEQLQHFVLGAPMAAGNYPLAIFPGWLRRVLTFILPVGAWGYLPISYLLGKGGSPLALGAPIVAAGAVLGAGLLVWKAGLNRYQSTGS
jgi:ABC-2 type transport system permease protein